jgi:hypothetical protein
LDAIIPLRGSLLPANLQADVAEDSSTMFGTDGREHVIFLLRTILESEGNGDALIVPIVGAVHSCMRAIDQSGRLNLRSRWRLNGAAFLATATS